MPIAGMTWFANSDHGMDTVRFPTNMIWPVRFFKKTRGTVGILICLVILAISSAAQDMEAFRAGLASGNTELKRDILLRIRNLHSESASRLAISALGDRDEMVRACAATAVMFLPEGEVSQVLIPLLNDKASFVRAEIAFALGEGGDSSAITPLIRCARKDPAQAVRSAAAIALGRIGDLKAVTALSTILFDDDPSSDNELLRRSAARSIGQIAGSLPASGPQKSPGLSETVGVLIKVLQSKKETDDTHRQAAFALGAIRDPSAAPTLRSHLSSSDYYLAEICRQALSRIESVQ
jgi:HEAT repeat protein